MTTFALLMVMLQADPVKVPVAGRPVDFSGAVGGPFEVRYEAMGREPNMAEPYVILISIDGKGDLSRVKPPELNNFPELKNKLVVDSVTIRTTDMPGIVIEYTVRAKETGKLVLPPWKFVYYRPEFHRWSTTYAEALEISVGQSKEGMAICGIVGVDKCPPYLSNWREKTGEQLMTESLFVSFVDKIFGYVGLERPSDVNTNIYANRWLWALPPMSFGTLFFFYRRRPLADAERANSAIASLKQLDGNCAIEVRAILTSLIQSDSSPRHVKHNAPTQVLSANSSNEPFQAIFARCDRAEFGPLRKDSRELVTEACNAIQSWKQNRQ